MLKFKKLLWTSKGQKSILTAGDAHSGRELGRHLDLASDLQNHHAAVWETGGQHGRLHRIPLQVLHQGACVTAWPQRRERKLFLPGLREKITESSKTHFTGCYTVCVNTALHFYREKKKKHAEVMSGAVFKNAVQPSREATFLTTYDLLQPYTVVVKSLFYTSGSVTLLRKVRIS